jgi:glycine/D-amino acid oxidase-like deaminating enzyme
MNENISPWLHELVQKREVVELTSDIDAEVLIVGAGIAGAMSAFFTLLNTTKSVVIVEAKRAAHGATGHNAGQVSAYFERSLYSIAQEFGAKLAVEGEKAYDKAWQLLEEVIEEVRPNTHIHRFEGHTGLSTFAQTLSHLKNERLRRDHGGNLRPTLIDKKASYVHDIPADYEGLYTLTDKEDILSLLETSNSEFTAVYTYAKGCTNSASLVEEILVYLIARYSDRFTLYENSPIKKVVLEKNGALVSVRDHTVKAHRVVLCTNGFEAFAIENKTGANIDKEFHHSVRGYVGYMSGYLEKTLRNPTAISYFRSNEYKDNVTSSYYYLTRRPFSTKDGVSNLISVGGPGKDLEFKEYYNSNDGLSDEYRYDMDSFLRESYKHTPSDTIDYKFNWHGLMGYTPNAIRRIGSEPCNPVLLYNLGCNGVGILLSIYGGHKIARHLNNEQVEKTIFDPLDKSCQSE